MDDNSTPANHRNRTDLLRSETCHKYGFSPDLGGKSSGVLSMRMQVIMDSLFAPIWGGKKGEFRDWTNLS